MKRALVLSVFFTICLSAGAATAKEQLCGYPFRSDSTFVTVKEGAIKVVDMAPTSEIESLLDKDGHCTCLNATVKRSEGLHDYNFKEIYRDSIAQVSPENAHCQRIKNETTLEGIQD